jgi:hypothetical protein
MSVSIINVSRENGIPYSRTGKQIYRVQLNQIHLVEFEHISEEGMSMCLRKAADAIDSVDIDEKIAEYKKEHLKQWMLHMGLEPTGG